MNPDGGAGGGVALGEADGENGANENGTGFRPGCTATGALAPKNDLAAGIAAGTNAGAGRGVVGASMGVVREMLGDGVLSFADGPCIRALSVRRELCSYAAVTWNSSLPRGEKAGKAAGAVGKTNETGVLVAGLEGIANGAEGVGKAKEGAATAEGPGVIAIVGAGVRGACVEREVANAAGLASTAAPTAVLFSGVSVRTCSRAFFSRSDARSMLRAAADASLIFSLSAGGKVIGAAPFVDAFRLGALIFMRSTRAVNAVISSAFWASAVSMLRMVRLIVSMDGTLRITSQ